MSLVSVSQQNMQKQTSIIFPHWFVSRMEGNFPVNPLGIVIIKELSFTIDANKMRPYDPCIVDFRGSKYLIWKNEEDTLFETEIWR